MKPVCLLLALLWAAAAAEAHDLTTLPLGDGKLSNAPKTGWVWACHTDPGAGGAFRDGPWIDKANGTYDLTSKAVVPGSVSWPFSLDISLQGDRRIIAGNDFPSHVTGTYPVPYNSEAYRYDRNPNRIAKQNILLQLPANPVLAPQASCAPGAIGILVSGAVLFNALDAPGRDAVAHETQDQCQGHPQQSGVYHYHSVSTCVDNKHEQDGHSSLVGYMVDGFGIYGREGQGGKTLTSADLDECHGHTHAIMWNGRMVEMYHYHATWDFPYTAGCLRGSYKMSDVMMLSGPRLGQKRTSQGFQSTGPPAETMGKRPDLNAAAASLGISVARLRAALGPPPPDLQAAAQLLGIDEERLRQALDAAR